MGKRKGAAIHEGAGKTGYPTAERPHADCPTHGGRRVSRGDGIGPSDRKNEGTRSSRGMGHQPGSGNGFVAPDRNCRKGTPPQRGKVVYRLFALKRRATNCAGNRPDAGSTRNRQQDAGKEPKAFPHSSGDRRWLQPLSKRIPRNLSPVEQKTPG